jgi:chorismate-pyruvate lyase
MARQAGHAMATCAVLVVLLAPGFADDIAAARPPAPPADWPDGFVARVEALALLQTLNAELLSHDSATSTLEQWCASHHLASPPRIVAERVAGVDRPPSEAQRRELGVSATEPVRYRHVKLLCGAVLLSEADNWYVPARLTPGMNRLLDTTDTPFGRAVQSLHFQRHTISARLLWLPLPEDWEMNPAAVAGGSGGPLTVPADVLQHRALLTLPDGIPISEVVETYSGNVLAFPPLKPAP